MANSDVWLRQTLLKSVFYDVNAILQYNNLVLLEKDFQKWICF